MTVVMVTARMSTEVAAREQVHLDSILAAKHPDCGVHLQRAAPVESIRMPRLPIVSMPYGGPMRVPLCSAWIIGSDARTSLQRIVKRKDPVDIEERARPYNASSGPEKAYCMPLPTVLAPSVSWVCVGNRRGILELLRYVRQIGSVRRHGYGIVLGWEAEAMPDASPLDALQDAQGRARRFLPADWVADAEAFEIGPVAPPYWHPGLRVRRVRPGVRCTLRQTIVEQVMACH